MSFPLPKNVFNVNWCMRPKFGIFTIRCD
jgi:hypothetical protein